MNLFAEISAGELIDKITILEIKLDRIGDEAKRANIARELAGLIQALEQSIGGDEAVADLRRELKTVNAELWRIEDDIRARERAQDFGALFVSLARSVYRENDRRADLKRRHRQRARRGEKLRRLLNSNPAASIARCTLFWNSELSPLASSAMFCATAPHKTSTHGLSALAKSLST